MSAYIGLDLGQQQDYSALAVVRRDDPPAPPPGAARVPPRLRVTYLHRWRLGTKYGAIVTAMKDFVAAPLAGSGPRLVIDGTGVGLAVLELFDAAGVAYEAVSIHGGAVTTHEGRMWKVPKKTLVAAVQVPMQDKRLTVDPPKLRYARELRAELGNFRYQITASAHEQFAAWREADHDDLVLALALACWRATRTSPRAMAW
jgi:hypothetical protein